MILSTTAVPVGMSNPLNACDPFGGAGNPGGDCDNDGISNGDEDANGNNIVDAGETDPADPDTDDDGINDGDEVNAGTDPLDACDPNIYAVPSGDCDMDGLTNGAEDSNNNGVYDPGEETDASNPDTDGDGYTDWEELTGFDDPTLKQYLQDSPTHSTHVILMDLQMQWETAMAMESPTVMKMPMEMES